VVCIIKCFVSCTQGEYNDNKFRTLVRYLTLSEHDFMTYAEVDIGEKAYSVNVVADLRNNTMCTIDIHLDQ
jgi:hypothetical protein